MIYLYFWADTREALMALGKEFGILTEQEIDGEIVHGVGADAEVDPWPGGSEWPTGIAIMVPTDETDEDGFPVMALKPGFHVNVRISGAREAAQTEGLAQTDENGNLLPVRQRTHFGQLFEAQGVYFEEGNLKGRTLSGVTLLYEDSIATPRRVWQ